MRYIITESRLEDIFEKYIDSQYGLVWDKYLKQFDLPNGEVFGNIFEKHFYYEDPSDEYLLRTMFGDKADELMFAYIRKRFPKVKINGVGDYGLDEDKF